VYECKETPTFWSDLLPRLHGDQIVYIVDPGFNLRVKIKWEAGGNNLLRMTAGFRREID